MTGDTNLTPDPAAEELRALGEPSATPSAWQRYAPSPVWREAPLSDIEAWVQEPSSRELLARLDREGRYPREALDALRARGLDRLFTGANVPPAPADDDACVTAWHLASLNELLARRNCSLAITCGVHALALLPAWIAATPEQLAGIDERVRAGAGCSMLLTELEHGSNLLRNQTRADPGTLDDAGAFRPVEDPAEATHYRVTGSKDMINGGIEHDVLMTLLRTGTPTDDPRGPVNPLAARADHTFFWIDRGEGVTALPGWRTLPAHAADISGVHFEGAIIPRERIIGRLGGGFTVVQHTLSVSRGAISALACGALGAAREHAFRYARRRNVYGEPIARLGAIASHLQRLDALDRAAAALSLKALSVLNATGLGAAYYTALAKFMACALAEEGVAEGRRVLSARALVEDLPYAGLIRDVLLYGVFDGTAHVMLEELGLRLEQQLRLAARPPEPGADPEIDEPATLGRLREIYAQPAGRATELLRAPSRQAVLPIARHLEALAALPGALELAGLPELARALLALVESLRERELWRGDQALRFAAARILGLLEALAAVAELLDPQRRAALGLVAATPAAEDSAEAELDGTRFTVAWLGARAARDLRALALEADAEDALTGHDLPAIEARLARPLKDLRTRFLARQPAG